MKQKNPWKAMLLALCMALCVLPTAAFAEGSSTGDFPPETQATDQPLTPAAPTKRAMTLNLADQSGDLASPEEGWSWSAETKTLTLRGVNIDVDTDDFAGVTAVILPDGATITTESGTKNVICNRSVFSFGSVAIGCDGALTITGDGELTITGDGFGILARGDVSIQAPVSISCAGEVDGSTAVLAETVQPKPTPKITIGDALRLKLPTDGAVVSTQYGQYIAESDGTTPATTVVLEKIPSDSDLPSGDSGTSGDTPAASPKTADGGIDLYLTVAAGTLLGGVLLCRRRWNF